ncbi:MAG: LPS-assembly protein LptD [Planctomycetota bacterium]|jgi:hypothetical protein
MIKRQLFILCFLALVPTVVCSGIESEKARAFMGQDLHLSGGELISYQASTSEHILVFRDGFSMFIGANRFSSGSGVVWLESKSTEFRGRVRIDYKATVYLRGNVSVEQARASKTIDLSQTVVEEAESMVVVFDVSGEVFVTAEKREVAEDISELLRLELYKQAIAAVEVVPIGPKFVVQPEAEVPELYEEVEPKEEVVVVKKPAEAVAVVPEERRPRFRYPVNIAPAGEVEPKFESTKAPDETDVGTIIGRFYLWQKQDEKGRLLELQADNAVVYYLGDELQVEGEDRDILARGALRSIYLSGDVVMTEGQRTVRCDELYYDFQRRKALAINAVMRNYDVERQIPIYVRAAKLRQVAENKFEGDNITLTSSEFYLPQISLNASSVVITDTTTIDAQAGRVSDSSYDAEMRDVRLKLGERTIFYLPKVRSNLQRPDVPLKSAHVGYDSDWGMFLETRWYLSRILGLREPEGTDSTFALDYYGERGVGTGIDIDYKREDYFGRLLGYLIRDTGEDDLGRQGSRRDLEPPRELRGRFLWRHRHFLPYNWQLTAEVSYLSDENFLEGYYRSEFNIGKQQETLIHLKRIEDNWGLSILGKARINDFVNELEELPSVEYHLTGQSLFDDKFTFYSDSLVGRFSQRLAWPQTSDGFFTFMSERAELDMPMTIGRAKLVPFVAGTVGYEDGSGFETDIEGSTIDRENTVWLGEVGARLSTQYWKVYPNVKSRLWDLNGLRHIVRPFVTAVFFADSDSVIEQRDILNVGISQRLQTKRASGDNQRTVEWMRLDVDFTWLGESDDASDSGPGPDRFIWNKPFIPLMNRYRRGSLPQDRRNSNIFGPRRRYVGADYIWHLSDTTAILSDMNFDMQSGVVQQFNIGFSHLRWPNLSYYIGSRYLRRIENNFGEIGSNAFTFAATYVLDPRYTLVFSQQFDFDYGARLRSDISLIRRYHRVVCGLTFSSDESLDKHAIIFSIWPQGVPELAIGNRRYMGLGGTAGF